MSLLLCVTVFYVRRRPGALRKPGLVSLSLTPSPFVNPLLVAVPFLQLRA